MATNLALDPALLERAFALSGEKTKKAAVTKALRTLLFEIQPTDTVALAAAAGLLAIVALLAGLLPARKASAVDPVVALRAP